MRMLIAILSAILIYAGMPDKIRPEQGSSPVQEQKPLFTFGIVSDVQYCNCEPQGTRFYRSSLSKLRDAVSSFRADSLSFIVNLGDLIDRDFESYKPVMNILDSSGLKVFHVTGNHDYSVEQRLKKRIPPLAGNREGYYSFDHEGYRLIFLNGNDVSTYGTGSKKATEAATQLILKLKEAGEPNAIDWNGGIGTDQMKWFKAQLDEAASKKEKVLVFCHFPVWPENQHNLLNYREVISLLENYDNILAWFSGHNHAGNYGNFNMIHCITLRGMVETGTNNSYAEIEIYKNKIWIKGYDREKSQILAI